MKNKFNPDLHKYYPSYPEVKTIGNKWRGIQTTQKRKYESKPITITNRFNQKSLKLPRIDDRKRWAGYPGLTGISRKLAQLVPKCSVYVEPFAGAAKVYQEVFKIKPLKFSMAVLNDKSKFMYEWLKREFDFPMITNLDFTQIMEQYNFKKNFFLIDPPWNISYYDQGFSFCDRAKVKDYDQEVLKICRKLSCKFVITTRRENQIMLKSGFNNYLLQSEYVVCGKYPKTLLTTNIKFPHLEGVI